MTHKARAHRLLFMAKNGHAEVNGLVGQTEGNAIVIEDISGLDKIDFARDIALYSQTTKSLEGFREIIDEIKLRLPREFILNITTQFAVR